MKDQTREHAQHDTPVVAVSADGKLVWVGRFQTGYEITGVTEQGMYLLNPKELKWL